MRAVVAAVLVVLAPLLADAAPPAEKHAAAPPLAVELAKLSLPKANWETMMSDTVAQVREQIEGAMRQQGKEPPADTGKAIAATMAEVMPTYQEMIDLQASLLAKHYAPGELQQLVAFYRTPLGQKTIDVQPRVLRDVNAYTSTRLAERMPQAMQRLADRLASPAAAPAKPARP